MRRLSAFHADVDTIPAPASWSCVFASCLSVPLDALVLSVLCAGLEILQFFWHCFCFAFAFAGALGPGLAFAFAGFTFTLAFAFPRLSFAAAFVAVDNPRAFVLVLLLVGGRRAFTILRGA